MATESETAKGETLPYEHLQPRPCPIVVQAPKAELNNGSKETPGRYDHLQPVSVSQCPIAPPTPNIGTTLATPGGPEDETSGGPSEETPGNPYEHLQPAARCPVVPSAGLRRPSAPPVLSSSDLTGHRTPILRSQDLGRHGSKESQQIEGSHTFGGQTETHDSVPMKESSTSLGGSIVLSDLGGSLVMGEMTSACGPTNKVGRGGSRAPGVNPEDPEPGRYAVKSAKRIRVASQRLRPVPKREEKSEVEPPSNVQPVIPEPRCEAQSAPYHPPSALGPPCPIIPALDPPAEEPAELRSEPMAIHLWSSGNGIIPDLSPGGVWRGLRPPSTRRDEVEVPQPYRIDVEGFLASVGRGRPPRGMYSPYIEPRVLAKPPEPCQMVPIVPVYPPPIQSEVKHYRSNMRYGYNGVKSRASYEKSVAAASREGHQKQVSFFSPRDNMSNSTELLRLLQETRKRERDSQQERYVPAPMSGPPPRQLSQHASAVQRTIPSAPSPRYLRRAPVPNYCHTSAIIPKAVLQWPMFRQSQRDLGSSHPTQPSQPLRPRA